VAENVSLFQKKCHFSIFLLKCVGHSGAFWGVSGRFGAFRGVSGRFFGASKKEKIFILKNLQSSRVIYSLGPDLLELLDIYC
jgi:hypothetical protein